MKQLDVTEQIGSHGGQYLTCRLGEEQYGIEILKVREIIGILPVTPLPHSHDYILGIINLRGRVIPIADLRTRFGMPAQEPTEETCIIVVEIEEADGPLTMGIVVDEVAEVCNIESDHTVDPPRFDDRIDDTCLLGMGRQAGRVIFLLDITQVLRDPESSSYRATERA